MIWADDCFQSKAFLQTFHQKQLSASTSSIETEQWSPVDVSSPVQELVNAIVQSAIENPPLLILSGQQPEKTAASDEFSKYMVIEEKNFYAVSAVTKSVGSLAEYLKIVISLPSLAVDTMAKIIEFLKVSGLLFGSALLKHISAIQLADMSSCPRSWSYAFGRSKEYHSQASRFGLASTVDYDQLDSIY